MLYTTIVQRDETGLTKIYEKARLFEEENALEAIINCKFSLIKVRQTLYLVREYQNRLNLESSELVIFSENFIEEYSTNSNQCFEIALGLMKKIGTTVTGSMKVFRKFCPVVRRQIQGNNVVPVLDYTKLTSRLYASEFFGSEPYVEEVKTLMHELSAFFHHLIATMAVCKDMIRKEKEVRGDFEQLKRIFNKSCEQLLKGVNELVGSFGNVKLVSDEELEERRKNARPMNEWLASEYHRHDKQWLRREAYILRAISGAEDGLDTVPSQFWPHDHAKGKEVMDVIGRLHTLGLKVRNTKTEGKKGKYDSMEMVYLLKWSGVSHVDANGTVVDEVKESHLYKYMQDLLKNGDYEFPSWQSVCQSRKYCYNSRMSHEEMASAFAAYLQKPEGQQAKSAVLPYTDRKAVDF